VWENRQWNYRGIYLDHTGLEALSKVFMGERSTGMWVSPGLYHDAQVASLLVRAHREDQTLLHMQRQARWWAAMGLLFGRYGHPKPRLEREGNEKSKLARVRDYIAAHYTHNLSIDELSPLCGLSRFHLMRSFAREYGMPPHAYVNQLRLVEAKKLINSGLRPADAAASVGFYDQSHLTRLFKRAYGITPGAYAALQPGAASSKFVQENQGRRS
jgi:AraC-like DNA-binding protein